MRYRVHITRRPGIADPEGTTVAGALADLGYEDVTAVRFGKIIDLEGPTVTRRQVEEMCRVLLANPALEDFSVEEMPE